MTDFDSGIPDIRVIIREATDENLTVDVPNISVNIQEGSQYNVNVTPSTIVTLRTGSFNTYADFAGTVTTASFALTAQTLIGAIESASWSAFAVTASYVSGAASSWDTLSGIPDGLVSSSAQATTWTVATASVATSSSFATTASYAQNADLFDGRNSTTFASTGSNVFVGNQTITGSINITGSISSVDYIDFNTASLAPILPARLQWDEDNGTAILGLKGGQVSLQLGQELVARVHNEDTVPLVDGNIVYISGAQGNRVAVKRASAVREFGSANTLGMVTEPIAVGAEGFITLYGVVNKLNTVGLTPGATLWLSTASGQYTQTRPEAPNHGVSIGYVERIHASVGSIYVKVDNGYELDELHDVNDNSTTSSFGDLLVKNGSAWINTKNLTGSYGITGSLTVTTGITGSISGTLIGTSSYAQYAVTASYVSGATANWDSLSGKPVGLVSSSIQINTGSYSGTFNGTLNGSASYADTSSYISGYIDFPDGLSVTGSFVVTGSITGSPGIINQLTSSVALTSISASYAPTILPSGVVSSSIQAINWSVATASLASLNVVTASAAGTTITFTKGNGTTFNVSIESASYATTALSASFATTASIAGQIVQQNITLSSSIGSTWTTITSNSQHLGDGTYAVTANITTTPLDNLRLSGIFSWYTGSVSSNDEDEIFLQRTGRSSGTASIFMRTQMLSASGAFLQIASDFTLPTQVHTFTFVKLI